VTRRRVVTERAVRDAARAGERSLDVSGAAVTPSARDAAKEAGVALVEGAERGVGPPPRLQDTAPATEPRHPSSALTIAIGADHGGVALRDVIAGHLRTLGHAVTDLGTTGTAAVDYPDFAVAVAREVARGRATFGIMVDGAGVGSCMAANKVAGVRAALCHDVTTAQNAREHNNANLLTLGGGLIGTRLALAVVETFLATPFAGGRHAPRVAKIDALDATRHG
jgi:ribose 5-phosphate isomerase B